MKKLFKVLRKAVRDRAAERPEIEPPANSVRIDGKTCLVTGANSGLGKAVAIDLARRGGHVLMACRSGHPDAGEDVRAASGSDRVQMLCCAGDAGKRSGIYLHMLREKRPSDHATEPSNGARLWQASETLLRTQAPPSSDLAQRKPGAPASPPASGARRRL